MEINMDKNNIKKILIVDDEINVCKSIRQAILSDNYEVDVAFSGEEAIQMDTQKHYDLIITDLMMPGISGMELLTSIKTKRPESHIIMVTGYPTIKTAIQAIKVGAFDYIPKPFTPQDLRSVVIRAFNKGNKGENALPQKPELQIPAGLYYMIGHTWLREKNGKLVYVGMMHDFFKSISKMTELELPEENIILSQGDISARIKDDRNFTHRIWSPVSGRIVKVNTSLMENFSLLSSDPYNNGWLFAVEPSNLEEDLEGLVQSK
jgi:CheY-like chemotaxis protein